MTHRANLRSPVVLVGVDYSDPGHQALQRGAEFAQDGTLHVAHVVDLLPAAPMPVATSPSAESLEDARKTLANYTRDHLDPLVKEGSIRKPARLFTHIAMGSPGVAISQLAADLDVDLIVVGTHGRRGFRRLLLGSVAESVLRLSGCPVFVERPKDFGVPDVPTIEPPCPRCVETRKATNGEQLWCEQHSEKHGRRHTYYSSDRSSVYPSSRPGLGSVS